MAVTLLMFLGFECLFRMWDLEREENYVLNLDGQSGYGVNEFITCIAFCANKGRCCHM